MYTTMVAPPWVDYYRTILDYEPVGPLPVESDGGSMAGNADMIRRSRHAVGASSLHFGRAREKRAGFQSKFSDSTARLPE